jgi:membrane protein implicated in regulation of membrane protease activity
MGLIMDKKQKIYFFYKGGIPLYFLLIVFIVGIVAFFFLALLGFLVGTFVGIVAVLYLVFKAAIPFKKKSVFNRSEDKGEKQVVVLDEGD